MAGIDQGLDFHQQRARAFLRHHHAGTGHLVVVLRQEQRGWVRHPFQPLFRHGEHAQLVDGAETVLDGAHQAEAGMGVALEIQHRVDDVFEHAGTGQRALFRHVTHQDDGHARLLGRARQLRRAFAHLRHGTGRRAERVGIHGLDRIDHHHFRLQVGQGAEDFFQLDLGLQFEFLGIDDETLGAQGDLRAGLFTTDIQHALVVRHVGQRLQQQGRLADAGIAADQHDAAGHHAAAQHAVEFFDARAEAGHVDGIDIVKRQHGRRLRQRHVLRVRIAVVAARFGQGFHHGVPLVARGALPHPFITDGAAIAAGIDGLDFCHGVLCSGKMKQLVIYTVYTNRAAASPYASFTGTRGASAHISS